MKHTLRLGLFIPACITCLISLNAAAAEPASVGATTQSNTDAAATAAPADATPSAPAAPANAANANTSTGAASASATPVSNAAPAAVSFNEPPTREGAESRSVSQRGDEPETLINSKAKVGGYGSLGVMYTRFGGKDAAQVCLEGALVIDHAFSLGAAGCGVARTLRTTTLDPAANPDYRTSFGYGGAVIRYQFLTHRYLSLAASTLVGAGAIASEDWDRDRYEHDRHDVNPDLVFVVEPQLSANLALTRWMRIGVTGGYRFVSGVDTKGLSESKVAAPVVGAQVQLGWF